MAATDRPDAPLLDRGTPETKTDAVSRVFPQTLQDLPRPPIFTTGSELVVVDFVVSDKSDRTVRGLSAKDFVVREDGKARPIVSFDAFPADQAPAALGPGTAPSSSIPTAPHPADAATVVLVDDGQLSVPQAERLRPALKSLLEKMGERGGSLTLVAPGSKVSVMGRFPTGAADIAAAADQIVGQRVDTPSNFPVADAEALAIFRGDLEALRRVSGRFGALNPELTPEQAATLAREQANMLAHDARARRDAIYDAASRSLDWLAARPGRHSLIMVSIGFASDPDDSKYAEIVTRSLRANAPIHFLDARGLQGGGRYQRVDYGPALTRSVDEGPSGWWEAAAGSTDLAEDTGGISISNTNDLEKGIGRMLDTMTTYYVLAYQPPAHEKPGYRKIKVEARTKGLRVRARRGYFSGAPATR